MGLHVVVITGQASRCGCKDASCYVHGTALWVASFLPDYTPRKQQWCMHAYAQFLFTLMLVG